MGLVEDQQRTGAELAQHVSKAGDVGLFSEQAVGDDEARARRPRIDREAAQPTQLAQALAVDDVKRQAELALKFVLPLHRHRGRRADNDEIDPAPQQQLARDEPGLDGLAEADIVGD
jgi:hypothetical protein